MTVARHVARNSLVQFGGRGITMAVSLAILTLLSRYLGPDEFGQYQLVIAFLVLLNLSDLGISTIVARRLSVGERDDEQVMGNVLAMRAVLSLFSMALAIIVALVADYSMAERRAIAVASLSFPLMLFSSTYSAIFIARLRMEYAALGGVAQSLTSLALMFAVAASGGGLIRMLIAYDAGFLVNSAVCLYFARKFVRPSLRLDPALVGGILRQAAPLGLAVVVIAAYGRIDIVLLRALTDRESVGYYSFAYRAVDLAAPLSLMFIGSVFPLLSSHHAASERAEFRQLYQRSQDVLTIIGISLLTLMILFARPIVAVVGGEEYAPAVTSLRILSMAFGLIWLSNLVDYSLIAVGKQGVLLWIAFIGLAVNLSSNAILIPMYGREGAATATVLTELAVLAPAIVILSRYIGHMPSFWVAWRLMPVAFLAGAVVYLLRLPWFEEAAITCALLLGGIALSRVVSVEEIRALVRREPVDVAIQPGSAGAGRGT